MRNLNFKIKTFLYGTVLAVLSFFILGLNNSAQANLNAITFPDFEINSAQSGQVWSVGELIGGAIIDGVLSFDVKGLRQTADNQKIQVFAMVDGAQPSLFDNHGYFTHLRARSWNPGAGPSSDPTIELKSRIDCEWIDGQASVLEWNPSHLYNFVFTWGSGAVDRSLTVKITDKGPPPHSGTSISWELSTPLPWPFFAKQQQIIFGSAGLANNPGFPAQAGTEYSSITLLPVNISPYPGYDDFGGYPPCDSTGVPTDWDDRADQPGTDIGDPYDDPNNPYDQCACVSIQGKDVAPCKDKKPGSSSLDLSQIPFSLYFDVDINQIPPVDVVLQPRWGLIDVMKAVMGVDEHARPEPALDINFSPPAATTGDTVAAIVSPQNFRTMPRNMFFNWCLTRGDNGLTKSYNETIASGGGKPATVANPTSWQANGCCSMLTRDPADEGDTDTDNDGMGDDWERRYFLGKTINGVEVTEDNFLALVQPADDYDNDGYQAVKFKNADGEYLTVTPALQQYQSVGTDDGIFYPGADDKLTNIEEYILDTNPTVGDTAGDGYGDEMSYLGTGAMNFPFTIDMDPGPGTYGYLVTVSAVGSNQNNLISISARSRIYNISQGQEMQIALAAQPEYISPTIDYTNEAFTLLGSLAAGEANPEDLFWSWKFNGEDICESDEFGKFCDVGSYEIKIGPETNTSLLDLPGIDGDLNNIELGSDYIFSVTATDMNTRRQAQASVSVPIVLNLDLTTACDPSQEDLDTLPADVGDPISICPRQVLDNPGDWSESNFQWSVDGIVDQVNSGIGQTSYPFTPTKPAGSSQMISVQVIQGDTGNIMGVGTKDFAIAGPQVQFISPATAPMSSGIGPTAMMATGRPGETIEFVAEAQNFPAQARMDYSWQIGSESAQGQDFTNFTFVIPETASVGATYQASVQVRGINENTGQVYDAAKSITLVVGNSEAALGSGNVFSRGMAALINIIPEPFRIAVRVVAIGVGICLLLFVIFRVTGRISVSR